MSPKQPAKPRSDRPTVQPFTGCPPVLEPAPHWREPSAVPVLTKARPRRDYKKTSIVRDYREIYGQDYYRNMAAKARLVAKPPQVRRTFPVHVSLHEETREVLYEIAATYSVSLAAVVREAVRLYVEGYRSQARTKKRKAG